MTVDRRAVMAATLGLGAGLTAMASHATDAAAARRTGGNVRGQFLNVTSFGVSPTSGSEQTTAIQKAVDAAAAARVPLYFPAGVYLVARIRLRSTAILIGASGATSLRYIGQSSFIIGDDCREVRLEGLDFDGNRRPTAPDEGGEGLITFRNVANFTIRDCRLRRALLNGVTARRSGGAISDTMFEDIGNIAVFSEDATGIAVTHTVQREIGNNGVVITRTQAGEEPSQIAFNRIERVRARAAGMGENGNAISVIRANGVMVTSNRVADCATSAVRLDAATNTQVLSNTCLRSGQTAIRAIGGSEGVVVGNNVVDGAAAGIAIDAGGDGSRLAIVQGNLVRNITLLRGSLGLGIVAEARTVISGNVVENTAGFGLQLGHGADMAELTATNNIIRSAPVGIAIAGEPEAGSVFVSANLVSGAADGAIRAMRDGQAMGPDLARAAAVDRPNFAIFGNVAI